VQAKSTTTRFTTTDTVDPVALCRLRIFWPAVPARPGVRNVQARPQNSTLAAAIVTGIVDWFDAITTGCELAIAACPSAGSLPFSVLSVVSVAAPDGRGRLVALTGCVACQNVPVTGVEGIDAIETGCVACQKVPVTAVVGALVTCTANVPALVTAWLGTETNETGCVDWKNVPVTGCEAGKLETLTAPLIGCVPCQNVPETGTGVARSSVSVSGPVTGCEGTAARLTGCVSARSAFAWRSDRMASRRAISVA
jgi:hypothetical protein